MLDFAHRHLLRALALAVIACAALGAIILGEPRAQAGPESLEGPASRIATADALPGTALAPRTVGAPRRVLIPAIGVSAPLAEVGLLSSGAMETPPFGEAAWYGGGPRPGAAGPAVIVAHVHGPAGDDLFADLDQLAPGDQIRVRRADGTAVFTVTGLSQSPKDALPYRRIWPETARPLLRLITCAGEPDPATGMYPDNTIVYAHLR